MLTAWSTRASIVTVNSGTVDFDSAIRRAIVACMREGSMTSVSGPSARLAGAAAGLDAPPLPFAAASTSSLTIRPSGPLPLRLASSTPSSAARRLASGEALMAPPPASASLSGAGVALALGAFVSAGSTSATGASSAGPSAVAVSARSSVAASAGAGSALALVGLAALAASALAGLASLAAPMVAIGAPILAGTPFSTLIDSTPSSSASRSKVALSDSTSARTSPLWTSSPSFFFHSRTVPSSIVSDSFGMLTSGIGFSPHDLPGHSLDVFAGRDGGLLKGQAVRHWHLRAAQPPDGGIQVVEAALLHSSGDLRGDAVGRPAFFDDKASRGSLHRFDDWRPIDRAD